MEDPTGKKDQALVDAKALRDKFTKYPKDFYKFINDSQNIADQEYPTLLKSLVEEDTNKKCEQIKKELYFQYCIFKKYPENVAITVFMYRNDELKDCVLRIIDLFNEDYKIGKSEEKHLALPQEIWHKFLYFEIIIIYFISFPYYKVVFNFIT